MYQNYFAHICPEYSIEPSGFFTHHYQYTLQTDSIIKLNIKTNNDKYGQKYCDNTVCFATSSSPRNKYFTSEHVYSDCSERTMTI